MLLTSPPRGGRPLRRASLVVAGLAVALVACGDDSSSSPSTSGKTVVVTYSVLGAVVADLVDDAASVTVLMPNGIDPHDYEPSAKDIAAVTAADVLVANGLELEETLEGALEEAEGAGVTVFYAGEHTEVRAIGEGELPEEHEDEEEHADEGEEHAHEHGVGSDDPHLWMSPAVMADVISALVPVLAEAGIDVGDRAGEMAAELADLDADVAEVLSVVPADERKLVTGHESLGYFADQYGFTLVGAVVPSLSSQAEAAAGEIAELKELIEAEGVTVIFTEIGTPGDVVDAIADETGAAVVELATHNLPDDGTYRSFMLDLANAVAAALAA